MNYGVFILGVNIKYRLSSVSLGIKVAYTDETVKKAYLGHNKVSLLQRCLYFRGILYEGFHCIWASLEGFLFF